MPGRVEDQTTGCCLIVLGAVVTTGCVVLAAEQLLLPRAVVSLLLELLRFPRVLFVAVPKAVG